MRFIFFKQIGGYPINNKNIEVQLLNKFIRHQSSKRMSIENEWFSHDLHLDLEEVKGSLQETVQCEVINVMKLAGIHQFDLTMKKFCQMKKLFSCVTSINNSTLIHFVCIHDEQENCFSQ